MSRFEIEAKNEAKLVAHNPLEIQRKFADITDLIVSTTTGLEEIKNRGFFKRLISNNTADLANMMLQITQIQQFTLGFVLALMHQNSDNLRMLKVIREEINGSHHKLQMHNEMLSEQAQNLDGFIQVFEQLTIEIDAKVAQQRKKEYSKPKYIVPMVVLVLAVIATYYGVFS